MLVVIRKSVRVVDRFYRSLILISFVLLIIVEFFLVISKVQVEVFDYFTITIVLDSFNTFNY